MFGLMTAGEVNNALSFADDKQVKVVRMTTAEFLASAEKERKAWENGVYVRLTNSSTLYWHAATHLLWMTAAQRV